MKNETVPESALHLSIGEFVLGDNGDEAKSSPFRMVARSGQPVSHPYWGTIAHDLDGMRLHKTRVAIDYAHDDKEVIGYANKFETASGDLEVSGALVPFKESDRATEVIHKLKAGVPYEASINFGGEGIVLERVADKATAQVNGYEFQGPGVIVRQWPLRGIAVCPYGADMHTSTTFSQDRTVTVQVNEEQEMSAEEVKPQADEGNPVDSATTDTHTAEAATTEVAAVEAEPVQLTDRASEGKKFLDAFGPQGGVWFAEGKSFEDATQLQIKLQADEIAELKTKLSASQMGEDKPVAFSSSSPKDKKQTKRIIRIAGKHYDD